MTVRMRHTRGHTGNRRSHHALKEPGISKCPNCGKPHMPHKACMHCGQYRGRQIIDVEAREARGERKRKAKQKEIGKDPTVAPEKEEVEEKTPQVKGKAKKEPEPQSTIDPAEGKPLSAEDLSRN